MFATDLPAPLVREAIAGLLHDAGIELPAGRLTLRSFAPDAKNPEGYVRIEVTRIGKDGPEPPPAP